MPGRVTPTCSAASPTPTARSATPPGCASSSNRSAGSSPCATCASHDVDELVAALGAVVADGAFDGEPVDYVDGVVFSATESYLVLGPSQRRARTDQRLHGAGRLLPLDPARRARTSSRPAHHARTTCGAGTPTGSGAPGPSGRSTHASAGSGRSGGCAAASTGSSIALDRRFGVADRLEARQGRPPRERVVQDVEVPLAATAEFLRWFLREVPIEPIWLCPLRLRSDEPGPSTRCARARPTSTSGSGRRCPADPGAGAGATNRRIEHEVTALGGHKSLYSESFYDEAEFDRLYGGPQYAVLKAALGP